MNGQVKISNIQFAMLAITSLTIVGHLVLLTVIFAQSRQDAWIAAIVGSLLGLIGIVALLALARMFPGMTLVEILCAKFSWIGKIVSAVYLLYFFLMMVLGVRLFIEAYKTIMSETPAWALSAVIILLTAYIVYKGVEALGRLNQIMLPVLVVFAISIAYLTMGEHKEYSNLLPILGSGVMPVAKGALSVLGWFGEFVIMGMLLPHLQRPERVMKAGIGVAVITCLFFLGPITGPIALFGIDQVVNMAFPTFSEIRYIQAGEVINRFDAIAVMFWTVGLMIRIALFFYGVCLGLAQLLRLPAYHPLVVPVAWLGGACAILFAGNYAEVNEFLFHSYVPFNLLMGVVLPLVLCVWAAVFLRKRMAGPGLG
jgi:spore germination protein KB